MNASFCLFSLRPYTLVWGRGIKTLQTSLKIVFFQQDRSLKFDITYEIFHAITLLFFLGYEIGAL